MDHEHRHDNRETATPPWKWVLIAFLAIAGYFLVTEHRAHLSGWFSTYGIWLVLLACPILHLFMHRGHGGHGGDGEHRHGRHDSREK